MLEIEIDGKSARVPDGSTVIEAAQQLGIYVPHFCYHKKLSIAASCRACLVQVEKAPKPLPACATPVTSGMKVLTHSDLAVKAQQGVIEFLLINHPLDCPVCDQGGECQLQDLAVAYGGDKSRYQEEKRVVFHKDVGALVSMEEMSRCIHCTRCVRFGQEIAGVMELGMVGRNAHSEITTFLDRTIDSELSGNMIDLCPVGALTSKPFRYTARAWELQRRKSISPHDSVGANIVVQVKRDRVMRVLPLENESVNECWISDRDRFSYQGLNSQDRLTQPMIKQGGVWHSVTWDTALDYVSQGLNDIAKALGGDEIAALASPTSTLEEIYLMQRLASGLGSGNMDFRIRHSDFGADGYRAGTPWLGIPITELEAQDAVLVVGAFLRKDHPLVAQRLRQAAKKFTEVSQISVSADDSLISLHAQLTVAPSQISPALIEVINAVSQAKATPLPQGIPAISPSEEAKRIATSLISESKSFIALGNVAEQALDASRIYSLAQTLAEMVGGKFGFLGDGANNVGGYVAKALPRNANAKTMFEVPRAAYVLFGLEADRDTANPQVALNALAQAKLVVHIGAFANDAVRTYADVLLPSTPFTETSGTLINMEGRIQSFSGVVKPLGDARPGWKILRVIGNHLQIPDFDYRSSEDVRNEVLGEEHTSFVLGLNNRLDNFTFAPPVPLNCMERIADVPIYSSDPLVRRGAALQKTFDARLPTAKMNAATFANLGGLASGDRVKVEQAGGSSILIAELDDLLPTNCVRVSAAHAETSRLGAMFGSIHVESA